MMRIEVFDPWDIPVVPIQDNLRRRDERYTTKVDFVV